MHHIRSTNVSRFRPLLVVAEEAVHVLRPSPYLLPVDIEHIRPLFLSMDDGDLLRSIAEDLPLVHKGIVRSSGVAGKNARLEVLSQELLALWDGQSWRARWHQLLAVELDCPPAHRLLRPLDPVPLLPDGQLLDHDVTGSANQQSYDARVREHGRSLLGGRACAATRHGRFVDLHDDALPALLAERLLEFLHLRDDAGPELAVPAEDRLLAHPAQLRRWSSRDTFGEAHNQANDLSQRNASATFPYGTFPR